MRLSAIVVAVVCIGVGCTELKEGIAVAKPQPPQDAWQLAQRREPAQVGGRGDLAFGIRETQRCLTGISLERATG